MGADDVHQWLGAGWMDWGNQTSQLSPEWFYMSVSVGHPWLLGRLFCWLSDKGQNKGTIEVVCSGSSAHFLWESGLGTAGIGLTQMFSAPPWSSLFGNLTLVRHGHAPVGVRWLSLPLPTPCSDLSHSLSLCCCVWCCDLPGEKDWVINMGTNPSGPYS